MKAVFSKYLQAAKANLRFELLPHFLLTLLLCALCPVIFGLNDLNAAEAAAPLEMVVSLSGVLLLTPLFLPEQDKTLSGILYTKKTPPVCIYVLRACYSVLLIILLSGGFTRILFLLHSDVGSAHLTGTVSTALFLGGLGAVVFAVSNNIAAAYMAPAILYVLALGGGTNLGVFDPFLMTRGDFGGKPWQMAVGLVLLAAAVLYRSSRKALR